MTEKPPFVLDTHEQIINPEIAQVEKHLQQEKKLNGGILSPWIMEMDKDRQIQELHNDEKTDIAIIGGGVSGVLTAYYALRDTSFGVSILEATRLAHGASGNNGGQLLPIFEMSFAGMMENFKDREPDPEKRAGLIAAAQKESIEGYQAYKKIIEETNIDVPYEEIKGYAGMTSKDKLITFLEELESHRKAGISFRELIISDTHIDSLTLDPKYQGLYTSVPHKKLQDHLQIKTDEYIAAITSPVIVINSALFSEKLVEYLQKQYPDRFALYEQTSVAGIDLNNERVEIRAGDYKVESKKVVLCTNGYKDFTISDHKDPTNSNFIKNIVPVEGYMQGYLKGKEGARAAAYLGEEEAYGYTTERSTNIDGISLDIVCVGGPQIYPEKDQASMPDNIGLAQIKEELNTVPDFSSLKTSSGPPFEWHGTMAYPNNQKSLRLVGPTPSNPDLILNLGCCGVGLALAASSGLRIARQLSGIDTEPSLFDPVKHSGS